MRNSAYLWVFLVVLGISGLAVGEIRVAPPMSEAVGPFKTTWTDVAKASTSGQYPPANLKKSSSPQVIIIIPVPVPPPVCRLPYVPSNPDPCDKADDVMIGAVLSWKGKSPLPPPPPPVPVLITFGEVPLNTFVNGMTIADARFSCGRDTRVTMDGPGSTMFNSPPNIEGPTEEVITIDFAVPVYGVAYGFVLSSGLVTSNATTITLFDATLNPVAKQSADATNRGFPYVEGRNIATIAVPVKRAVITFSSFEASRFVIDNLTYSLGPGAVLTDAALAQPQDTASDIIFADDMESGPQNWTHYLINGDGKGVTDTWTLSSSRSASGMYSWHSGITAMMMGDTALESPVIDLSGATTARLNFNHLYHFDDCGRMEFEPDGGIVEIQVPPSSAWVQIFPVGGYPGRIMQDACGNPLAGKSAYTHDSGNVFVPAEFDLTPYVGKAVKIRFHVAWDCGNCEMPDGWFIDDVVVSGDTTPPNAVYDVYFGADNPPKSCYVSDISEPQCRVNGLACNTTYYWKVVAKNECGTVEGPVWSFRTLTGAGMLERIIDEKHQISERISELLQAEAAASRDIGTHLPKSCFSRERRDGIGAMIKVHKAMQSERLSKFMLDKSIDDLNDALKFLEP